MILHVFSISPRVEILESPLYSELFLLAKGFQFPRVHVLIPKRL